MDRARFERKLYVMANFCDNLAGLSSCRKRKVGAIIVPTDFSRVMAIGYNGPPAGIGHDKCDCEMEGGKLCVHAEANSLLKLDSHFKRRGLVMIVSLTPCEACAGLIVNSQEIGLVLCAATCWPSRTCARGLDLLREAGVPALDLSLDIFEAWSRLHARNYPDNQTR